VQFVHGVQSVLVGSGTENPRVGGSIPSLAMERPRFDGVFCYAVTDASQSVLITSRVDIETGHPDLEITRSAIRERRRVLPNLHLAHDPYVKQQTTWHSRWKS